MSNTTTARTVEWTDADSVAYDMKADLNGLTAVIGSSVTDGNDIFWVIHPTTTSPRRVYAAGTTHTVEQARAAAEEALLAASTK